MSEKNDKIASGILQLGIIWILYEHIRYYKIFYDIFLTTGYRVNDKFIFDVSYVEIPRIIEIDYRFSLIIFGYIVFQEARFKYDLDTKFNNFIENSIQKIT